MIITNQYANNFALIISNFDNIGEIKLRSDATDGFLYTSYSNIRDGLGGLVYNDSTRVFWLDGNINLDPTFYDEENYDFRLFSFSPCLDSGNPLTALEPDSSRADMGYFYYPEIIDIIADSTFGYDNLEVNFSEISIGFTSSSVWSWDFDNNGSIDSNVHEPNYLYQDHGIYDVKLIAEKGQYTTNMIKEKFIVVVDSLLPTPENIFITLNSTDVILDWDMVENADFYLIYTSADPYGDFGCFDISETLSYTHENALIDYDYLFYFVIGFNGSERELKEYIEKHQVVDRKSFSE